MSKSKSFSENNVLSFRRYATFPTLFLFRKLDISRKESIFENVQPKQLEKNRASAQRYQSLENI